MPERLNSSETEKTREKAKPILTCLWSAVDLKNAGISSPEEHRFGLEDLKKIDWMHGTYGSNQEGSLTAGPKTYIISAIDDCNKFSENLNRCTSLVVSGVDQLTQKNVSFLTHQPPAMIIFLQEYGFSDESKKQLIANKYPFIENLRARLSEMKKICEPGTIVAVIVGGLADSPAQKGTMNSYTKSIEILKNETETVLGFSPKIVNGPKEDMGKDDIYFDNKNRRLYFIRPTVNNIEISEKS